MLFPKKGCRWQHCLVAAECVRRDDKVTFSLHRAFRHLGWRLLRTDMGRGYEVAPLRHEHTQWSPLMIRLDKDNDKTSDLLIWLQRVDSAYLHLLWARNDPRQTRLTISWLVGLFSVYSHARLVPNPPTWHGRGFNCIHRALLSHLHHCSHCFFDYFLKEAFLHLHCPITAVASGCRHATVSQAEVAYKSSILQTSWADKDCDLRTRLQPLTVETFHIKYTKEFFQEIW